jgi:protein phosphatase
MFRLFGKKSSSTCKFRYAAVSERGLVRENNEDSHLELPQIGIFCIADGMGGGDCGELASAWVCKEIDDAFREPVSESSLKSHMERCNVALERANDRIRAYARENDFRQMGSTAVVFVGDPDDSARAAVCHVGDSRLYRWRRGRLECLTFDHTVGGELCRVALSGCGKNKSSDRSDPISHVLTRAVGPTIAPRPEWRKLDIETLDTYLICTDGVHDMLSDDLIAQTLSCGDEPGETLAKMREEVVVAGAFDNFTMICIKF